MELKDNGDWLSAQQAVRPDGTEVINLPLINKKLPPIAKAILGVEDRFNAYGMPGSEVSKLD